jgi:predicted Fe-Mo cluster-binding NifX family protein
MRIAISAETNNGLESTVSHHFGRCPYFVLVDIEQEEVKRVEVIDNPHFQQHQPGMVPGFINDQKADVMLSGGMGRRAIAFFEGYGIGASTGATGTVEAAVKAYLNGGLREAAPCRESILHHQEGHSNH